MGIATPTVQPFSKYLASTFHELDPAKKLSSSQFLLTKALKSLLVLSQNSR
jgi:hypothetical protein